MAPRVVGAMDLPSAVLSLAGNARAQPMPASAVVEISQRDQMWSRPGARPSQFTARQLFRIDQPAFLWMAKYGPLGLVSVTDCFIGGRGELEARLLGLFTVAKMAGNHRIDHGELMRYLAELPWNPDAILSNDRLTWDVKEPQLLLVGVKNQPAKVAVSLRDGLIDTVFAEARPRAEGRQLVDRPWRGRFWDYRSVAGRRMPIRGEVAWVLDGKEFVYWRGEILSWNLVPGEQVL